MDYSYRAVTAENSVVTGTLTALDIRQAARILRKKGFKVTRIEEVRHTSSSGYRFSRKPTTREVTVFMHQLCVLLESGVPMDEAVDSLVDSAGHPLLHRQCIRMSASLRRGMSFSQALAASEIGVPAFLFSLIEAGELTGHLAQSLRDGLNQWQYELDTRKKLIHSLTYPAILIVSGVTAVLLVFILVVPKFVKILDKSSAEIPFLARLVLGTGKFFHEKLPLVIVLLVVSVTVIIFLVSNKKIRQRVWDFFGELPLLGQWVRETDTGRWAAMLATLLDNKVDLIYSLEIARCNVSLTSLRNQYGNIVKSVRGGASLSQALMDAGALHSTGLNLVRVGERSGKLPAMLQSLASLMDESVKNRMELFLLLVEPAAILIIGAVVGVIMAGIILAITSVNNITI
jgi:general secretion pathway protein F